jgi:cobalt/nickel transport system permease protein
VRHDFLDRHSRLDSPVHRLPAAVKLLVACAVVVGAVLVPSTLPLALAGVAALLLLIAGVSRVPWSFLLQRVLALEPFVLGVAVLALFRPGGWPLFLFLVARSTVCLLAMVLLASTTPFSELLRALRAAGMPALLVTTLSLMYRYIFVLVDEAGRMRRARASRTFTADRRRAWRGLATVIGQLFIRSSERAERIYAAMTARGWR